MLTILFLIGTSVAGVTLVSAFDPFLFPMLFYEINRCVDTINRSCYSQNKTKTERYEALASNWENKRCMIGNEDF